MRNAAEAKVVSVADGRQRYATALAKGSSPTCAAERGRQVSVAPCSSARRAAIASSPPSSSA